MDGVCTPPAPRPIAPLSTSRVTSRRPTLHWELPTGVTDTTVDLCLDRACTKPIGKPVDVTGTSYAPPDDLPTGVVFWRLHPSTFSNVTSPTWEFWVGARSAPVDTSWGTTLNVNGDGYADLVVGASRAGDSAGAAYVYLGGPDGPWPSPAATLLGLAGMYGLFGDLVTGASTCLTGRAQAPLDGPGFRTNRWHRRRDFHRVVAAVRDVTTGGNGAAIAPASAKESR